MTTTAQLETGQIVRHPEKGYGIVTTNGRTVIMYAHPRDGLLTRTDRLTGWERVETVKPGHVQVRVDDLDLNHPEGVRALWMRVQRLTTDPDSHETYEEWAAANNSRCNAVLAPGHVQVRVDDLDPQTLSDWSQYTVHSDCDSVLVRTGRAFNDQQVEYNPRCPKHGEKPTSATVTLPCPDCGEGITHRVVVRLDPDVFSGGYYLAFEGEYPVTNHRCPPAQPDEPTEPGTRWTLDGKRCVRDASEKGSLSWLNVDSGHEDWYRWADFTSHVEGWEGE